MEKMGIGFNPGSIKWSSANVTASQRLRNGTFASESSGKDVNVGGGIGGVTVLVMGAVVVAVMVVITVLSVMMIVAIPVVVIIMAEEATTVPVKASRSVASWRIPDLLSISRLAPTQAC